MAYMYRDGKPNKRADMSLSYHPRSLLSRLIKENTGINLYYASYYNQFPSGNPGG